MKNATRTKGNENSRTDQKLYNTKIIKDGRAMSIAVSRTSGSDTLPERIAGLGFELLEHVPKLSAAHARFHEFDALDIHDAGG